MKLSKSFVFMAIIALLILAFFVYFILQLRSDRVKDLISEGSPLALLWVITSDEEAPLFNEVLFYHPATNRAALVDVPGNIGSIIQGLNRVDRIDVLFKYANPSSFRETLEGQLGTLVPFSLVIKMANLARLVDLLGGIEVFIADPVEASESGGTVLLPAGNVLLDGSKAVAWLNYIEPEETDSERVGRAQRFIQSIIKRIALNPAFVMHQGVNDLMQSFISANFDQTSLKTLLAEFAKIDSEAILTQRVLGVKRTVDNQELVFPHFEGQLIKQNVKQILDTLASSQAPGREPGVVTIEILNGTEVQGLARRTREIFQSFGYEVISFKNAEQTDVEQTIVTEHRGNPEYAKNVAKVIQCKQVRSEPAAREGSADVTVLLGKDFDGRYCK